MKISEISDWAIATFGEHSHKATQILAALGPLEEWLGHLARHGVQLELVPGELWKAMTTSQDTSPPAPTTPPWSEVFPGPALLDPVTFVQPFPQQDPFPQPPQEPTK